MGKPVYMSNDDIKFWEKLKEKRKKKPVVAAQPEPVAELPSFAIDKEVEAEMEKLVGPPLPPPPIPKYTENMENLDKAKELEKEIQAKVKEFEKKVLKEQGKPPQPTIFAGFRKVTNFNTPEVTTGTVKTVKSTDGFSWKDKSRINKSPTTTYIITMLFGNATCEHYIIDTSENFFVINKKRYHLNKLLGWYDVNFHQNRLIYYEDYVEPIEPKIKIEGDRAYLYITPSNMKEVMEMEYVKILSQSAELTKWLKILIFICIGVLGLSLINTIIFIVQSGVLQSITGAVKGG